MSVRGPAYLYERMFPRLEQRLRAQLDLLVELSTLGEYRVAAAGGVVPTSACSDVAHVTEGPRPRGARCAEAGVCGRHEARRPLS